MSLLFISLTYSTPSVAQLYTSSPLTNDIVGVSHFFASPSEPSSALIVPKSLHGLCVLYELIADDGT